MNEIVEQLRRYLRGMWQRRWIGLAAAWIIGLIAVVVVYRIPERFEATARVYVDTETLLKPLLAGLAIQPNVDQQVALISRTLISRPNIEKLIHMSDLDLRINDASERETLIDKLLRSIQLIGGTSANPNLYVINYRDPDPEQARKVVQSLLAIFVESSVGDKRQDSRTAVKFLDEQIRRYEESLKLAEGRLKDFKLKYLGVAEREGGDFFARLAQIQSAIETARLDLQAAEQARDSYKRDLAGEQPTFLPEADDTPTVEAVPELDTRLATLRKELDELLRKYTENHPDVVGTRRLIKQVEEQKRVEVEARRKAAASRPKVVAATDRNPVFEKLRLALAESEAMVASSRAKLAALETQYRSLRAQAQLVPQVEAEYAQLNRDYDVQKKTYETLLARRESAELGIDVQDSGGAQFRVIDPPRVSPRPVAPNRITLLALAFVASLGAGFVASFLATQLLPTFPDARTLREVTQRPVLGMVSMLTNPAFERRARRGVFLFASGVGGLIAAFAAVLAVALTIGRAA